jgi:hypothetical protein
MRVKSILTRHSSRRDDGERGATAVIVVLSLVAIFGLIVLTVDVGQLLFQRRIMVNASDAAALAAAQSCAGLDDSDIPESMADTFALQNSSQAQTAGVNIIEMVGCDGPPFGHVTVQYGMSQDLFFAGVLGFDGPAAVSTEATAGWGPAGGANPLPIVVYTGDDQGNCDIPAEGGVVPDVQCYMWYDNDTFENSSFGFLNLCTAEDQSEGLCPQQGWDVASDASCPNVGTSLKEDWIRGDWLGGPNEINYPDPTYVCVVSGLADNNWRTDLRARVGKELVFPVNDCTTQVDASGDVVGCSAYPNKYNIIGFIVLRLEAVYVSQSEWGGTSGHCGQNNVNVIRNQVVPLASLTQGQCPDGTTPSGVENLLIDDNPPGAQYTYDDTNKSITWIGPNDRVDFDFDWWLDGQCGRPPGNNSAVCLRVVTVEARFDGTFPCPDCPDFGDRAVRLCDMTIGSCPEDES